MTTKAFVGRLGDVPVVRAAQGRSVANFDVAETKRRFDRDRNEWVDDFTIWHNVESWRNTTALGMLAKGTLVMVIGEERDGSYENREGQKVRRTIVRASEVGVVVLDAQSAPPAGQQEPWSTPSAAGESWGGTW